MKFSSMISEPLSIDLEMLWEALRLRRWKIEVSHDILLDKMVKCGLVR